MKQLVMVSLWSGRTGRWILVLSSLSPPYTVLDPDPGNAPAQKMGLLGMERWFSHSDRLLLISEDPSSVPNTHTLVHNHL